jgi:hypothetical protein
LSKANLDHEVDELLNQFTPKFASPFYLDENVLEYMAFVSQLKESIRILLDIVKSNNLSYHSYEYKVEDKVADIAFGGSIDLLFYQGERPFIIDLKWTFSQKKYITLIEEEKSIQLALYAKLMGQRDSFVAYFLLSHGKLLTTDKSVKGENIIVVGIDNAGEVNERILAKTMNSFNYRWSELSDGRIELAEESLLSEIQYHNDSEAESLISLEMDKKYKKNKKSKS